MKTKTKLALKSSKRVRPNAPVGTVTKPSAAPSQSYPPIADDIIHEVYQSMELLGADYQLLAMIGSWNETLPDEDVLAGLRFWIKKKELRRQRKSLQPRRKDRTRSSMP